MKAGAASTLVVASTPRDMATARRLFEEYRAWLGVDLCFQGFDDEVRNLPGKYAAPRGRILLARDGHRIAGVVAVAPLDARTCEMKRLFVRPRWRGRGLGRRLAIAAVRAARGLGYRRMRLDTLARLEEACQLYRSMGFATIPAYYRNPLRGVLFMELDLGAPRRESSARRGFSRPCRRGEGRPSAL